MNELIAIAIIICYLAIGYLFIYPRAKAVTGLRWMDATLGILSLGTVGALFSNQIPSST